MLPTDMLRVVSSFLKVKDSISMENALVIRLFTEKEYRDRLYVEPVSSMFLYDTVEIWIDTFRLEKLYSVVKKPMSNFLLVHKVESSTAVANKEAYDMVKGKYNKILRRRLEMVGL
tara:strand:+ start:614 stop:961 length:348 start_codon:yes stop_codon:yes gene_type:complete